MSKHSSKKVATDAFTSTLIGVVFPPILEWCQKQGLKKASEEKFLSLLDLSKPVNSVISQSIGTTAKRSANKIDFRTTHEDGFCKHRFCKGEKQGKYCPKKSVDDLEFCRSHLPKEKKSNKSLHVNDDDDDDQINASVLNEKKGIFVDQLKKIVFHSDDIETKPIVALGVLVTTKPLKYKPMSKHLAKYAISKGMDLAEGAVEGDLSDSSESKHNKNKNKNKVESSDQSSENSSDQASDQDDPKPLTKNKKSTKPVAKVESSDESSDQEDLKPSPKKKSEEDQETGKNKQQSSKSKKDKKNQISSDQEDEKPASRKGKK